MMHADGENAAATIQALLSENRRLLALLESPSEAILAGPSTVAMRLRSIVALLATSDADVLVTGPAGTGKARLAQSLHRRSSLGEPAAFSTIACDVIPDPLVDREFGRVSTATAGTLCLEESDRASPLLRRCLADLLRRRSAGDGPRVVLTGAGTPTAEIITLLRSPVTIEMPRLQDRRDDIPLIFAHLLDDAAGRLRRPLPAPDAATITRLAEHDWPGNLRELADHADRLTLGVPAAAPAIDDDTPLVDRVAAFERGEIERALTASRGDAGVAMAALGLPRKTFYYKVQRHGIDVDAYRQRRTRADTKKPDHR